MYTAAFDLTTTSRAELVDLLRRWTTMSARLTAGLAAGPLGATGGPGDAPPDDTGEALDLPPAGLTITIGFGRSLFVGPEGAARATDSAWPSGCRPASSGSPTSRATSSTRAAATATCSSRRAPTIRRSPCTRSATSPGPPSARARVRWSQLGFGRTSSTSTAQATPRNLLGFKDGTANIKAEETADVERHVWVQPGDPGPGWLAGGTYVAVAPDPDGDRDLGPLVVARAGGDHRPRQGRRRPAVGRDRVHRARPRRDRRRRAAAGGRRLARPARPSVAPRRRPDASPGLHLHGRQRLARAARRRPVLRGLRARPTDGLHPGPGRAGAQRRAQRVPPAHGLGPVRGAGRACPRSAPTGRWSTTRTSGLRCSPEPAGTGPRRCSRRWGGSRPACGRGAPGRRAAG